MPNALKGMIAGLVATLVLSALMVLNNTMNLMPQIHLIGWLTSLGTLSRPAAWMDHFIIGVVVWGLLFAVYDGLATRPSPWLKGIIFGVFAWLIMMLTFLPLAGAGFFGAKIDITAKVGLLVLHLIYGVVLGATYGLLGVMKPLRISVSQSEQTVTDMDPDKLLRMKSPGYSFNDDIPSSSPSGKMVLIIFGGLVGFFVLVVLIVEFRTTLGL
jgi:hypothetical protein